MMMSSIAILLLGLSSLTNAQKTASKQVDADTDVTYRHRRIKSLPWVNKGRYYHYHRVEAGPTAVQSKHQSVYSMTKSGKSKAVFAKSGKSKGSKSHHYNDNNYNLISKSAKGKTSKMFKPYYSIPIVEDSQDIQSEAAASDVDNDEDEVEQSFLPATTTIQEGDPNPNPTPPPSLHLFDYDDETSDQPSEQFQPSHKPALSSSSPTCLNNFNICYSLDMSGSVCSNNNNPSVCDQCGYTGSGSTCGDAEFGFTDFSTCGSSCNCCNNWKSVSRS